MSAERAPAGARAVGVNVAGPPRRRRVGPAGLAAVLGNWSGGSGPLYRQLADAFKAAVVSGDLLPGTKLPAERPLAEQLAVSRSTLLAAFEELKREGWLESRRGSGTWMTRPDERVAAMADNDSARSLRVNAFLRTGPAAPIDLATAVLPAVPAVAEALSGLGSAEIELLSSGHGYVPSGLPELRAEVARSFAADGIPTSEDEVLITTGAQQALSLIAGLTLRAGDLTLVENPTAPGLLDALRAVGADIRAVPVDEQGVRLDVLEDLMARLAPRVVFVTPTFHNPTGALMPATNRRRLATLAERMQTLLVEDLSPATISLTGRVPPPIASYGGGHVLSVGSMSRLFWGGLRVGWIRGADHLVARLTRLKAAADLGTPLLSQVVAAKLLPQREQAGRLRREQLRPRRERLTDLLADQLPAWSWRPPPGGLAAWIAMPGGSATAFASVAQRHGVVVVPGPVLSPDESHRSHLRLSFAPGLALLEEGVDRLAQAWLAFEAHASDAVVPASGAALV
jgi:DNA-binding transcriptional MocR family regulator